VRPKEGALGTLRIVAGADQTHGLYFAFESETPPAHSDSALDVHARAAYDESEYVLIGRREIVVEGQQWQVDSGFFALAPRHARQGMRTIGSESSRWLHFYSPAEIERYFVERERLRERGATAEQLQALSQRYSVGDAPCRGHAEPGYASAVQTRHAGVIATGLHTRNAYALAERSTLPEEAHVHADQEEEDGPPVVPCLRRRDRFRGRLPAVGHRQLVGRPVRRRGLSGGLALLLAVDPAAPDGDRLVGYTLLPKDQGSRSGHGQGLCQAAAGCGHQS
jgi:mannose-6-phosphate isomerase-like protein (cupin superfamily)